MLHYNELFQICTYTRTQASCKDAAEKLQCFFRISVLSSFTFLRPSVTNLEKKEPQKVLFKTPLFRLQNISSVIPLTVPSL